MTAPLILPQAEFELMQRAYRWLLASGHANCGGFRRDPGWAAGHFACVCGQAVLLLDVTSC